MTPARIKSAPAGDAAAIPEEDAHAEKHGNQRDAESAGAEEAPEGADHADLIGEEIPAHAGHGKPKDKVSEAAGSAANVA